MALTQTQVSQLYISIFGRASEGAGNTYWQATADMATAANTMLATSAAATYFGTSLDDNAAFIKHIYLNTLGKTYAQDTAGVDYWVTQLATQTRGEVVAALVYAAQQPANAGAAQDMFNNKVAVSNYCADNIETADIADLSAFTGYISGVTDDDATVTAAQGTIAAAATADFTLTTAANTVIGTSASDIIKAAAGTYSNTADVIIDQSSTDSDTFVINEITNVTFGTVAGIENINVNLSKAVGAGLTITNTTLAGGTMTIDVAPTVASGVLTVAGETVISVVDNSSAIVTTDVTNLTVDMVATHAANTITTDAAATTVAITDAGKNGVTLTTKATTISVDGAGDTISAVASDKASVSSAGTVALATAATDQVELLTLSGNGAAVTYSLTGVASSYTFAGTQNITLAGAAASFSGKTFVNSATGTTTLKVSSIAAGALDLSDSALLTNVQLSADFGAAAANDLTVNSTQKVTVNSDLGAANGLEINAADATATDNALTLVIGDDGVADVVGTATTTTLANAGSTKLTNFATIAMDVSDDAFTSVNLVATGADITLTGSKNVTLGVVTADSIAATAFAGVLNLTYAAAGSVASGSGADVIVMDGAVGTEVQSVSTAAGNDIITITDVAVGSAIDAGDGDDIINLTEILATVIAAGAGNDTVNITGAVDSVINAGTGTDELVTVGVGAIDFTGNTHFAFSGFENFDITTVNGIVSITNAQFAGQTFTLEGSANDILTIDASTATAAQTINTTTVTGATANAATMTIVASDFGDTITAGSLVTEVTGGDGADTIVGSVVTLTIDGGAGNDTITTADVATTSIAGGAGDDTITTGNDADVITGDAGNDTIAAGAGDDAITGGAGADVITTGVGSDTIVLETYVASEIDSLTDFNSGVDFVGAVAGAAVSSINQGAAFKATIDGTTITTLVDAIDAAIAAGAAGNLSGVNGDGYVVTITDSTTAGLGGVYAIIDANSDEALTAADYIVKLVGTSETTLIAADLLA